MEPELTIGEVARRTGLSAHALRFYEREGLLIGRVRRESGHRRYTTADVEWLDVCVKLRASGMPLATVGRFAELVRQGRGNEHERLELLREHQARIAVQLAELDDCLQLVTWKVGVYEQHLAEGTAQGLWAAEASTAHRDPEGTQAPVALDAR